MLIIVYLGEGDVSGESWWERFCLRGYPMLRISPQFRLILYGIIPFGTAFIFRMASNISFNVYGSQKDECLPLEKESGS